jgi:hypothetical protein
MKSEATAFANNGWGEVIATSQYRGLQGGLFCVVSGPQSHASAATDRSNAVKANIAKDVYVKRACTDAKNIGD